MWRTSRHGCLLCLRARYLLGCIHLYVADKWRDQAIYPSRWPSLTEAKQKGLTRSSLSEKFSKHERSCPYKEKELTGCALRAVEPELVELRRNVFSNRLRHIKHSWTRRYGKYCVFTHKTALEIYLS